MSVSLAPNRAVRDTPRRSLPQRIAVVRALLALVWAAALLLVVGHKVPSSSDLPTGAALVLASYPAIDVVASIATALGTHAARRVLWINAAISALAVAAVAATAFGADAGATLVAFGAWAALSGTIQLGVAVHRRRAQGRQLPMIVSGGLSTVVGVTFIASSGMHDAQLTKVAGYMAFGALLYLLFAYRSRTAPRGTP